MELLPEATDALVTLYIGNRNRKGVGSIARAMVSGTTERTTVEFPFGETACTLASRWSNSITRSERPTSGWTFDWLGPRTAEGGSESTSP